MQWPVEEVESLRMSKKVFNKVEVKSGSVVSLDVGPVSQVSRILIVVSLKYISCFTIRY